MELSSAVDRAEAGVSDPITFRVTLDAAPGVSVSLPEIGPMIQGFRILDMGSEGPVNKEGRVWRQDWFKLQADVAGSYLLPAIKVSYKDAAGKEGSAEAPQIFVQITSAIPSDGQEKDIRDLKPLERIPREFPLLWAIAGAACLLVAGGVAGWALYRRKKRAAAALMLLPADELARRELADLEATGILEEERYREYVFVLSLIFRRFLERKYQIAAAEQTSEEIMSGLRKSSTFREELKKMTRSFLEDTDPIKYCGLSPRAEETESLRAQFFSFLELSGRSESESPPFSKGDSGGFLQGSARAVVAENKSPLTPL